MIGRQSGGKLELLLAADGGTGDTNNKYTDLEPAIGHINRKPLSVISTDTAPPRLAAYVRLTPSVSEFLSS